MSYRTNKNEFPKSEIQTSTAPPNYAERDSTVSWIRNSCPRHHVCPLETLRSSQHYGIDGLKGVLNWVPNMPRRLEEHHVLNASCSSMKSVFFNLLIELFDL